MFETPLTVVGHTDICRDETVAARNPVNEAVTVD